MRKDLVALKDITKPIKNDLKLFQNEFNQALKSKVLLIDTISKYMTRNMGKKIRPILTILSARLCGEPTYNTFRSAAMVELLHVATLVHDDVVDDATLRRGKPSINSVWKNKISVLMGDFILSKALINMIKLRDFDALEQISKTAEELSAGEILQIEKSVKRSMNEKIYFDMIGQKTASLIATSCELGAITTTKKKVDREAMYSYGKNLGIAFQIKDDLFDIMGSENDTGKNKGGDVKKNMLTLPIIFTKSSMPRTQYRELKMLLKEKEKTKKDLNRIYEMVDENGGIEYAKKKLDEYSRVAINSLNSYPESKAKSAMIDLVSFNAQRIK